jgi:hypothetical protein
MYMKKQNSRWATIYKNWPQCYVVEHEIGLLNIHDDSSEDERLVKAKRRNQLRNHEVDEVDEAKKGS